MILARASPATQSDKRTEHEPTLIFNNPRKSGKEFLTADFADFTDKHTATHPYHPRHPQSESCDWKVDGICNVWHKEV